MQLNDELKAALEREYGLRPLRADPFVASNTIATDAEIGRGVMLGHSVSIHEGVRIGDGCSIGDRVTLRNCCLEEGVRIEDNCIVGYETITGGFSHKFEERKCLEPTTIGSGALVRTGSVIYQSVAIGDHSWINHMTLLREHTNIGHHTCIGSMSDSEGYNQIGNYVLIHSQVQLCARITIEDYVFVAPMTVFANGNPMGYARPLDTTEEGGIVRFGAQVAVNTVVMPRVEIGYEAVVGPSSIVSRDVPDLAVAMGSPARVMQRVAEERRLPIELRRRYYAGAADPPARAEMAARLVRQA